MSGKAVVAQARRLYHGTDAAHLESIQREGLKPFGSGRPAHELRADRPGFLGEYVYLTTIYGLTAAAYACRSGSTKALLIEVATDGLDEERLCPDELRLRDQDNQVHFCFGTRMLTEAECRRGGGPRGYKSEAAASLRLQGSVAYDGVIGAENLRRYAVVNFAGCPWWHRLAVSQRITNDTRAALASLTPLLFDGIASPCFTAQENDVLLKERECGVRVECF